MRTHLAAAAAALVLCLFGTHSVFASIEFAGAGDQVRLFDGPGNNGGIFYVDVIGQSSSTPPYNGAAPNYDFPTFCVEIAEHIALGSQYTVSGVSTQTVATGKNLGSFAAWLYTEFLKPAFGLGAGLTGITGWSGGDAGDANAIQYGIWKSMGWTNAEIAGALGAHDATFLANLQSAYAADLAWTTGLAADANWNRGTTIGSARIMNLVGPGTSTANAQDQLVWSPSVPEPMSLFVWSMLATCVGAIGFRSRQS